MGNVASVKKAINHLGIDAIITNDKFELSECSHLILPGVGAFAQGMKNLNELNLVDFLTEIVIHKKMPFLGICLGMQLLATYGYEPTESKGLNWIEGKVIKMVQPKLKIPHLGWNNIEVVEDVFLHKYHNKDFYFIHSFHFEPDNEVDVLAKVDYGNKYVAAIKRDNIFATQFHPEKSQIYGLELLRDFLNLDVKD